MIDDMRGYVTRGCVNRHNGCRKDATWSVDSKTENCAFCGGELSVPTIFLDNTCRNKSLGFIEYQYAEIEVIHA